MTNLGPTVDIGQVFGADVSYATLGAAFHVNAYEILVELCKINGTNATAFDQIYRAFRKEHPWLTSFTSRSEQVVQYWGRAQGGTDPSAKHSLPFLNWKIPAAVVIRLPLSAKNAILVTADATTASRYIKLSIDCPQISKLDLIAERIEDLAGELDVLVTKLEKTVVPRARASLGYLVSSQRLLMMMCDTIPNTPEAVTQHHAHEHADLLADFQRVVERGAYLVSVEPNLFDKHLHQPVNKVARKLLAELSDADNAKCLSDLMPYYDVAEHRDIWARFEFSLSHAASVLCRSSHAEEFVEHHMLPFLAAMAEGADVNQLIVRISSNTLKQAVLDQWRSLVPSGKGSKLKKALLWVIGGAGTIGTIGGGLIGNSRGPASLAVALMEAGGPICSRYLVMRSLALDRSGVPGSALCLRVLMRVAGSSSVGDIDTLISCIFPEGGKKPDLKAIAGINWSANAMPGNRWVAAYAFANLAVLMSLFTKDADVTFERIAEVVQSGAQLAVPLAEIAATMYDRGGKQAAMSRMLNTASKLAVFAGVLSFGIAAWTCYQQYQKYEEDGSLDFEGVLGIAGSVATFSSVGAWLYMSFCATHAVAIGLMTFGSILAVAVVVVAVGYEAIYGVPGTAVYMRSCIKAFKASDAGQAMLADKEFGKALAELESNLDKVKRDLVSFSGHQNQLFSLARYFSPDGCATILELSPETVRALLDAK